MMTIPRLNRVRVGSLNLRILGLAFALIATRLPVQAADRFWWDCKINSKPVRLILDTGCSPNLMLWRSATDRLGLKRTPTELDSQKQSVPWDTEEFKAELPHWKRHWGFPETAFYLTRAGVCEDLDSSLGEGDGAVGWPVIRRRVTRFDAIRGKFEFLGKVPKQVKDWSKFTIRTNTGILVLELPGGDGTHRGLIVDTGSLGRDLSLAAPLWDEWMAAHPNERKQIGCVLQVSGLIPYECARASSFTIGGLTLANVELDRLEEHDSPWPLTGRAAAIGFGVLKRFDLVVDGKHALAYMQPSKRWKPFMAEPPNHTLFHGRPGAVFGPWRNQTNGLSAYVMSASPAFEAGIRNGDILLKVDQRDLKPWLDNPGESWSLGRKRYGFQWIEPSTNSPNGAALELTLRRQDQVFQATVLQSQIAVIAPAKTK
jgi:hypothetical protein